MQQPLEDIKVLDLTHALAGPFCSTMLADFGAQVIKLEPPGAGDIARSWGTPMPGGETSYFVGLHRNKRGIVVDLKKPEGKELFFRLVEKCDVVLENYRVGRAEAARPRLRGGAQAQSRASSTARSRDSARTAPIATARRSISSSRPRAA